MRISIGLLVPAVAALSACEAKNLYIAHDTVLGINAALDQGRQQGQLVIGYDRDFAAVVPKTVEADDGSGEKDAMALLNCTHLEIKGIYLNRYSDVVVTGEAAKALVNADILNAARDECEKQANTQTGAS